MALLTADLDIGSREVARISPIFFGLKLACPLALWQPGADNARGKKKVRGRNAL
jgi:hypothetical protein